MPSITGALHTATSTAIQAVSSVVQHGINELSIGTCEICSGQASRQSCWRFGNLPHLVAWAVIPRPSQLILYAVMPLLYIATTLALLLCVSVGLLVLAPLSPRFRSTLSCLNVFGAVINTTIYCSLTVLAFWLPAHLSGVEVTAGGARILFTFCLIFSSLASISCFRDSRQETWRRAGY